VIHGTNDSLAAVEEARHFAWSLARTSHEPVVYAELPGAQHAFEIFHGERTSATVQAVDRFLAWTWSRARAARRSGDAAVAVAEPPAAAAASASS